MADIQAFLNGSPFAVVGASGNRAKYGNKVLRCYLQHGRVAIPIHPFETEVEGVPAFASLSAMPQPPHAVSVITPAQVTERVLDEAIALGVRHVWMQPGAEHAGAIERAEKAGLNVIAYGPCLLVVLGFHEH